MIIGKTTTKDLKKFKQYYKGKTLLKNSKKRGLK
jgi:hypothetical protein